MINFEIERRATVTQCTLTPRQWEIYENPPERAEECAEALNTAFATSVNAGMDRDEVDHEMYKVINKYRDMGTTDSECYWMVDHLLNKVFGGNG